MTCQSCVRNITSGLVAVDGIASAVVSLEAGTAEVVYDINRLDDVEIPGLIVQINSNKFKAGCTIKPFKNILVF